MKLRQPNRIATRPAPRRQRGFSLIEVLVAVLVMGIGVLGVTALQMVSLQNNRAALEQGEAVQLAYDIMDRIRSNSAAPGAYNIAIGAAPPAANDCTAGACTPAGMANFDLASWKCQLGAYHTDGTCTGFRANGVLPPEAVQPGLPQGDGAVAENGGVVTVTVQWTTVGNAVQTVTIDSQG